MGLQPARGYVHERAVSQTVEWCTPPEVFERLGIDFTLDPCGNVKASVPCDESWTPPLDGLTLPWRGRVWMNPPYGPEMPKWIDRFIDHADGIALVFARTDTRVMQRLMKAADAIAFTADRLHFIQASDGYQERAAMGSMFAAFGEDCATMLERADFGVTFRKAAR